MARRDTFTAAWRRLPHPLRWIAVAVAGASLIVVGAVFLVLPGPGLPLIALGLLVLATEFAWAERTLHRMKRDGGRLWTSVRAKVRRAPADGSPGA